MEGKQGLQKNDSAPKPKYSTYDAIFGGLVHACTWSYSGCEKSRTNWFVLIRNMERALNETRF